MGTSAERPMGLSSPPTIRVGRVYDPRTRADGARVLVDRLWPRGLRKSLADLDGWCRVVTPSTQLRKWYGHDPDRFEEFGRRYRDELDMADGAAAVDHPCGLAATGPLTLLTATKRTEISGAVVLADLMTARIHRAAAGRTGAAREERHGQRMRGGTAVRGSAAD